MSSTYSLDIDEVQRPLEAADQKKLDKIKQHYYDKILQHSRQLDGIYSSGHDHTPLPEIQKKLISDYELMGELIEELVSEENGINVFSFDTDNIEQRSEVSRLISKLRSIHTRSRYEFVYYMQRAYELLFKQVFIRNQELERHHLVTPTPVTHPCRNYAVHRIPNVESQIEDTVMCVMLRGALLPSMILSKEIQEYSNRGYMTPFALFRIKRSESGEKLSYVLDLEHSYFNKEELEGKHLIFADPMNATGGSILTILRYFEEQNIKPAKISLVHVITALPGAIQIVRSVPGIQLYTLWMDPVLNEDAYIMPGLGDAGDRLNGTDGEQPRNMVQLIADYGSHIVELYRNQVRTIEKSILG